MTLLLLLGLLGACHRDDDLAIAELGEAPPEIVAATTSGLVSRKASIEVEFVRDMVGADQVGQVLDRPPLEVEGVAGRASWVSPTLLRFTPDADLEGGRAYRARVDLAALLPEDPTARAFAFRFGVVKQAFEPKIAGLAADGDASHQALSGTLRLADVADDAAVEKMLRVEHGKDSLSTEWQHAGNEHRFTVRGIVRGEDASSATLRLVGEPIGVDHEEEQQIAVPGLNQFVVNAVSAVLEGDRHIELRFSDPLLDRQDLAGLIRVEGRDDVQLQRDGSIVSIYASSGWKDSETVLVAGLRNMAGYVYKGQERFTVSFAPLTPQVKFASPGVILPSDAALTVPLTVQNVSAVEVEAIRVHEANVPQFLQVNGLDGARELERVGKVVWKERVEIPGAAYNRVQQVGLDVSELVKAHPSGLYRLSVRFRRADILLDCPTEAWPEEEEAEVAWDEDKREKSFWDYFSDDGEGGWTAWEKRDDPCSRGFYLGSYDHDIRAHKNVVLSDLGLIAKQGADGLLHVLATDLVKATPLADARIEVLDYQLQSLGKAVTGNDGATRIEVGAVKPFAIVARHGEQVSWLRLDKGGALATSHFDVGGAEAPKGLQGFLYGERGVWRPGDDIFLSFVLHDTTGKLPAAHPAEFELVNPRGQVVDRRVVNDPVGGFYRMSTRTGADAPTGNYLARVRVGGAVFEKSLRVETVVPNRLKIDLAVAGMVKAEGLRLESKLASRWLHGAKAPGFKADIELRLSPRATSFPKYADYVFDDPLARFAFEPATIWEGELDEEGVATVEADIPAPEGAPGQLAGSLRTRVFEPSGGFSVDEATVVVSPHTRYVGVKLPKGDAARGMLLTDQPQTASFVLVDEDGKPLPAGEIDVALYKINWRWWWEKGPDALAEYAESKELQPLQSGTVSIKNGVATWDFQVNYPDWGRYLLTAVDKSGSHRVGKAFYMDWPGWAGRARPDQPGGASVLSLTADRPKAEVGQTVTLSFPMAAGSRALVSLESGAKVVQTAWVEAAGETTSWSFTASPEMAPGVYANVTVVQPHARANDAPLRLYGITPIEVFDPGTRLRPKITTTSSFQPESTALVSVAEEGGRPMSYTLAVVDEGLLGLTRFATPDAWTSFFARPAHGVRTWDLYDQVVGAYGGALDGLIGIGGDGAGGRGAQPRAQRFKPMVHYEGPFALAAGEKREHSVPIPQYVGEVRVMVVAGGGGAYGAAEQSVPVKKPLMVLATLPRVLGPQEKVELPVSVFALDPKVKDVSLSVAVEGPILLEEKKKTLRFSAPGDQLANFALQVQDAVGVAKLKLTATGGGETATQTLEIDVRHPGQPESRVSASAVLPGKSWAADVVLPGVAGTNSAVLELSRVPPVDLGRRLEELIHYPHGCIEQTTSGAFPQAWLSRLMELPPEKARRVETNVRAAITRLRGFQNGDGGFGYWPGQPSDDWGSTYAGHFLLEAERAGYLLPAGMRPAWVKFQRERANRWVRDSDNGDLAQAYRLYSLALAGQPDIGAMNRLKEVRLSPVARWRLAAAWALAGQKQTAEAVLAGASTEARDYRELSGSYGSKLRDQAMMLEAATLLGDLDRATRLATEVSAGLTSGDAGNTQSTAYALVAMARFAALGGTAEAIEASWSAGGAPASLRSEKPLWQTDLDVGKPPKVEVKNTGSRPLYARVISRGVPPIGKEERAEKGLALQIEYRFGDAEVDPARVGHGDDLVAHVTVQNRSGMRLEELALSQVFPSGWQVNGLSPGSGPGFDHRDVRDDRVYTYFDLDAGKEISFDVPLNASYAGVFYLPPVRVEAMYDSSVHAQEPGRWVTVDALPQG